MGVGRARSPRINHRDHPQLLSIDGELLPFTSLEPQLTSSQIPAFYQMLDRCDQVLDPKRGLMGVVDFYTSRDGGIKERVSREFRMSAENTSPDAYRRSAPKASGCRGSLNGSGSAGSRWTTYICMDLDEVGPGSTATPQILRSYKPFLLSSYRLRSVV